MMFNMVMLYADILKKKNMVMLMLAEQGMPARGLIQKRRGKVVLQLQTVTLME